MGENRTRGPAGRRLRRASASVAAALLAAALATTASADLGLGPGVSLNQDIDKKREAGPVAQEQAGAELDTDYTPIAKDGSKHWSRIAGAGWQKTSVSLDSPTGFDTDLYDVAFPQQVNDKGTVSANTEKGFAVGSRCLNPPKPQKEPQTDLEKAAFGQSTTECEGSMRVPAIYRYTNTKERGAVWERVEGLDGEKDPGYVGAVAWMDTRRALAVGGTGRYPYREEPSAGGGTDWQADYNTWLGKDPAGDGRAWLYED